MPVVKNAVRTSDVVTAETASVKFDDFLLKPALIQALNDLRFHHPSPVQLKTIPKALEGRDLLVQAKSGTGKTLAFALVLLQHLESKEVALVLAPTREIALQTEDEISRIGWHLEPKIKVRSFVGGTPETSDAEKCKDCQIFVGTPGRVLKLLRRKHIPTPLRFLVLDEADKLLEESFREPMNAIIDNINVVDSTQLLAVSATFPSPLVLLAEKLLGGGTRLLPEKVFLCTSVQRRGEVGETPNAVLEGVKQCMFKVDGYHVKQKVDPLFQILACVPFHQCIVFLNNATQSMQVAEMLNARGVPAIATSGKQDQSWRRAALIGLKRFQYRVVVASDLWARGVDVSKVDLVVNLDLPIDKETYLHRAGRCGRFGASGLLVNVMFHDDMEHLTYFQTQLELDLIDWSEDKDRVIADLQWKGDIEEEDDVEESAIPADTFDLKERRIDPQDGCSYYIEDFIVQYGGNIDHPPAQWLVAQPEVVDDGRERRIDPADGCMYTLHDFILEYGGDADEPPEQWTRAINPKETRIDHVDNNAYTFSDFIEAYGGSAQQPPDEWYSACPSKNNDTRTPAGAHEHRDAAGRKKKTRTQDISARIPSEHLRPDAMKSDAHVDDVAPRNVNHVRPDAMKSNARIDDVGPTNVKVHTSQSRAPKSGPAASLWQLFPPPALPAHLVPPGSGIPHLEPWMASCDYAQYAKTLRMRSPFARLWTQHANVWRGS
eukprot:GEMP01019291.1.p1 GENE.GEMP01019291.1~~GEMP01019291.1.p1  ORF type:complete len:725 (+),score=177.42 GEMP01019291.1:25-2175(+)